MRRFGAMILGCLMALALFAPASGASEQGAQLRAKNALSEYTPPETLLSGNFVADEVEPVHIFGKVKDFVKARSCSTTWLIEEGEKKRVAAWDRPAGRDRADPAPTPGVAARWRRDICFSGGGRSGS